jgi:hypothetical protein
MIKPGICISKPLAKSFKQRNFCGVNRFAGNAARNSRAVISLITDFQNEFFPTLIFLP